MNPPSRPALSDEPVAIVGIGCRFPGAPDPAAFWQLLATGGDGITEVPAGRWDARSLYDPDLGTAGTINSLKGGFLDNIDAFDARFFEISAGEARYMDPQQRLLLEVGWEALENAALVPAALRGSAAGVYIGTGGNDFARRMNADLTQLGAYSPTGQALNSIANRLSHFLDWRGPSLVVDTACSSALVAVHLASQALAAGEIDLAIAGGVNVILSPATSVSLAQSWMLAPDGHCKSFDARADGYGRSEGCGAVVLKRLSDALAAGDRILAVIRGSAVNQDGGTSALSAPSLEAQQTVIRSALDRAGIAPAAVDYIEAHGIGSILTDRIEWQALSTVFDHPCRVGCVKSQIGHLEWAAGIASLIKVVLCLQEGTVPANWHLGEPAADLVPSALLLHRENWPWLPADERPRLAGINAFGLGGTNCHLVVEEGPARPVKVSEGPHTLVLSAKTAPALDELAARYARFLETVSDRELAAICFTAATGRSHFAYRLAVHGHSAAELRRQLDTGASVPSPEMPLWVASYLAGEEVDWKTVYSVDHCRAALPTYPFQRRRYWPEGLDLAAAVVTFPESPLRRELLAASSERVPRLLGDWLKAQLAELIDRPAATFLPESRLFDLGLTSLAAVALASRLQRELGLSLTATVLFDYPTIEGLTAFLARQLRPASNQLEAPTAAVAADEPIAVVGLGCRFPGAENPDAFWQLLIEGRDAITQVPSDRWDIARLYDPDPNAAGKVSTRWGGFLEEVDRFDAAFFGIAPREAISLDPQQRLLLEVSWEALEAAGQNISQLNGSRTGVFVGISTADYAQLQLLHPDPAGAIDPYFGTGTSASAAAGRISYLLGLVGPSMAVDTACSSSLVAVHLACQSLRGGECNLALAGGVNLLLAPLCTVVTSRMHLMAPDGRCKTFDERADGYVRSEGCGVVVLKRLSEAERDGDPILAVIRGSAVNQDGPSGGLTVPNGPAQQAVIRSALTAAGVAAQEVSYVEAHGTGTALGDPIEIQALAAALGEKRREALLVGSVKTNIGHLEAAAGVAGLIKTVLALHKGQIPAHLHLVHPNPHVDWQALPVAIPRTTRPWPVSEAPAIAGVSAFSFVGTNAHVILEAAPAIPVSETESSAPPYLLPLSARDRTALAALAHQWGNLLSDPAAPDLADLCYTAAVRRTHHRERLGFVGSDRQQLLEQLTFWESQEDAPRPGASEVVFVFSGQGPRSFQLDRQLLEETAFLSVLEECDRALLPHAGWSLLETLEKAAPERPSYALPILFAVQVALAALWRSWGVVPDAVVGHSVGEVAAACVAGVLRVEEAIVLVYHRGRLLEAAPAGRMAAIGLSAAEVQPFVEVQPDRLGIAALNSPRTTVLWGEETALTALIAQLEEQEVFARMLPVERAFHSPAMESAAAELVRCLGDLKPQAAQIPIYSTVSGSLASASDFGPEYWGRNLRQPVRFHDAIRSLPTDRAHLFVELNVHPVLAPSLRQYENTGPVYPSLRNNESSRVVLLNTLARLYEAGRRVNWPALHPGGHCISLPAYPWSRERYWLAGLPELEPLIVEADTLAQDRGLKEILGDLVKNWADDDTQAINRRFLAPFIFLGRKRQSCFYFNRSGPVLLVSAYIGSPVNYRALAAELLDWAASQNLRVHFLAKAERTDDLQALGFSTTPCGVWQSLKDLEHFSLQGNSMRRLRYQVNHYAKLGNCTTLEYRPGGDPATDRELIELIDEWSAAKGTDAAFLPWLQQQIRQNTLPAGHRLFLIRQEGMLDGAIFLAPAGARNGYLMDLEFYRDAVPLGCLEFGIVNILEQLRTEGRTYFSLGATLGTELGPHPAANPAVEALFASLHERQILNGDGNYQFKNKFRPETTGLFLCRSRNDTGDLQPLFTLLAHPERAERPTAIVREQPAAAISSTTAHPLLGRRLRLAVRDVLFESELSTAHLPFLADHRVAGQVLFPLAAVIELVRAGARAALGSQEWTLRDLKLQRPLVVKEVAIPLQLALSPNEKGGATFALSSLPMDSETDWQLHATGIVELASSPSAPLTEAIVQIRERSTPASLTDHYQQLAAVGLEYGPAFQAVTRLWQAEGEALAEVILPESLSADSGAYRMHPALLDSCLRVLAACLPATDAGAAEIHVPVGLEAFEWYRPCSTRLWSYARLRPADGEQTIAGDLYLCDEGGEIVALARGLQVRRTVVNAPISGNDSLYGVQWQKVSRAATPSRPTGRWLIAADRTGVGEALACQLRAAGAECELIFAGDASAGPTIDPADPGAFRNVLSTHPPVDGVIHLWGLEAEATSTGQLFGCGAALHWLQALAASGTGRLWLVSRGAQSPVTETLAVAQTPLWGLGRAMSQEQPEHWGGLIDLDPAFDPEAAATALVQELLIPDTERQLVLRGGERYAPRLVRTALPATVQPLALPGDATYLIVGGLGGLGIEVAQRLVQRGARYLVLLGRRAPTSAIRSRLQELEAMGAQLLVVQADIADQEQLQELLEKIDLHLPPLRGIVHAAGIVDDGVIEKLDWSRFERVLAAKVSGAWHLHHLTRSYPLDFFVCFSSMAALLGPRAQASYAAANAFLDGLAQLRHAEGLPALTINWGPWGEVGMASALPERDRQRLAEQGLEPIAPAAGLAILEAALTAPGSFQLGVLNADWQRFAHQFHDRALWNFVAGLVPAAPADIPDSGTPAESLEARLIALVARVLKLPAQRIDQRRPLVDLGLDSLMALELSDQIQAACGVNVPVARFFGRTDIAQLAEQVREELEQRTLPASPEPVSDASPLDPATAEQLLSQLDQLTDEEVSRLLNTLLPPEGQSP